MTDTNVVAALGQFTTNLALLKHADDKAGIVRPTSGSTVNEVAGKRPAEIFVKVGPEAAERAVKLLTDSGAKAELVIYNLGPDVERGWGARRSVARDFVNDSPVLLGSLRVGPDLASIGTRAPEKFAAPWKFAGTNNQQPITILDVYLANRDNRSAKIGIFRYRKNFILFSTKNQTKHPIKVSMHCRHKCFLNHSLKGCN